MLRTPKSGRSVQAAWPPTSSDRALALRRKIEVEPARPRLLQTEPGVGYRMRESTS